MTNNLVNFDLRKAMGTRQFLAGLMFVFSMQVFPVYGQQLALQSVKFSILPGDQLQLQLKLNGPGFEPNVFHTDNPPRIALDFPGVSSNLKSKVTPVNTGSVTAVHVVEAAGRTRVVINLVSVVPYETRTEGSSVFVVLKQPGAGTKSAGDVKSGSLASSSLPKQSIESIDFRRGPRGEGRIMVSLSNPNAVVDMQERGGRVVLYFINTSLPEKLTKRLDVIDFATPVRTIDSSMDGSRAKLVVTPVTKNYEYLSYQTEGLLTLEFRPLTYAEKKQKEKKDFRFTGERLSLNFQDIAIRSVLQILADFTDLNIVASDSVKGNVTLRLNDVPWDQAMDLILKSKGLDMRKEGNIVRVAPAAEINKQEKEELQALAVKEELDPLKTEIIQIKYAKAADIQTILQGVKDTGRERPLGDAPEQAGYFESSTISQQTGAPSGSILSKRGTVNIDTRTNVLIVKDTARNLEAIRRLVAELDTRVRQVLIEARVVIADNNFTRDLGSRIDFRKDLRDFDPASPGAGHDTTGTGSGTDLFVDLLGSTAAGTYGLTLFKVGDYLLDLELNAAQIEGRSETLANPRVVTSDQSTAKIERGIDIPYLNASSQNGSVTQFKKAVLSLEVTPQITPDNKIVMQLKVNNDSLGVTTDAGPAINTENIETTVTVDNGETVVLGGIFTRADSDSVEKVPFFGDLPLIGYFFQKTIKTDNKAELLIFITPKILEDTL